MPLKGPLGSSILLFLCFLASMISSCPLLYTTLVLPHCRPRAVAPVTTRIQSKPSLPVGCLPKAFCHHSRELSQVLRPTVALMHPLAAVGWFCSILMAVAIWNRRRQILQLGFPVFCKGVKIKVSVSRMLEYKYPKRGWKLWYITHGPIMETEGVTRWLSGLSLAWKPADLSFILRIHSRRGSTIKICVLYLGSVC